MYPARTDTSGLSAPWREALPPLRETMIQDVVLPLAFLATAAWVIPLLLFKILPEGVIWLILIGAISTIALVGISASGFYILYGRAGDVVLDTAPWHFAVLSARAALVWAPVMVLSLSSIPRRWKRAVW